MMRTLLLAYIDLTDAHPHATLACGATAAYLLACLTKVLL